MEIQIPYSTVKVWLPSHKLCMKDKNIITSGQNLDDFIILTAMNYLTTSHSTLLIQPPAIAMIPGYEYCPHETLQITHNGANLWVLLSSMEREVRIYDSLNMPPTDVLINQMKQFFHQITQSQLSSKLNVMFKLEIMNVEYLQLHMLLTC